MHYDCVILLVGSGSNINKADSNSCTALHYASAHDEDQFVIVLILEINFVWESRTNKLYFYECGVM